MKMKGILECIKDKILLMTNAHNDVNWAKLSGLEHHQRGKNTTILFNPVLGNLNNLRIKIKLYLVMTTVIVSTPL